ncbi:MAG: MFS transporter [Nitrososphaerales archaeon]
MFSILRQRNFGLLWFGQVISMAGDWVLYASLAFYVYALTGSVLLSGSMMIVSTLPRIVLGTVAGVFVDRWDRRRTMIVADLGRAAVLLSLLAVRSAGDMWIVYLAALGDAALAQFFGPAKNALVPRIVTTEELVRANSANSVGEQIGRLAGPAVGGFMLARLGLPSVVIFDVLSFVASAGMIALIAVPPALTRASATSAAASRGDPAPAHGAGAGRAVLKIWRELVAGLRLMRANQVVAGLFLLWTITSIGEGLLDVLVVPWVSSVLAGTSLTFGWMMTAQASGSIAGGAILASAGKTRQARWLVVIGALGWGLIDLAIFNARSIPLALVLFVLVGIPIAAMVVSFNALIQSEAPDEYRGRVFGSLGAAAAVAMLAGMAVSSALADRVGIVTMLNVACVTVIIGAAAGWVALIGRPARGATRAAG